MIKEKMASLGKLVAGIAHEVNNPIGAVNSASDVVDRALAKIRNDDNLKKFPRLHDVLKVIAQNSEIIKTGSARVVKLVQSLKNFARLDEAEFQEADIHEGLESTLTLVFHELKNKVTVVRDYGDIPPIQCFPNELNQVFMNLFVNAAQAIKDKGTLSIRTSADDRHVFIEVADSGEGIPAENLGRIFDPGFTTKGVGIGTGLGLAISYNIIRKHKGKIEVKSEQGSGTTFTITLPVDLTGKK
jgi:signal transduction histidine kinase